MKEGATRAIGRQDPQPEGGECAGTRWSLLPERTTAYPRLTPRSTKTLNAGNRYLYSVLTDLLVLDLLHLNEFISPW